MRIAPIHNIRCPGLIPNGFQKEEAPPPTPDQNFQPEIRNKSEAQTDTRHAVEFINPLARMEVNASNRTSPTDRLAYEMGFDSESLLRNYYRRDAKLDLQVQEYERILKDLVKKFQAYTVQNQTVQNQNKSPGIILTEII